jgi:hypothetical protein
VFYPQTIYCSVGYPRGPVSAPRELLCASSHRTPQTSQCSTSSQFFLSSTDELVLCRISKWTSQCSTRALCVELVYAADELVFCKLSSRPQLVSARQFSVYLAYIGYAASSYTVRFTSPPRLPHNQMCLGIYPENIQAFAWILAFALRLLSPFFIDSQISEIWNRGRTS